MAGPGFGHNTDDDSVGRQRHDRRSGAEDLGEARAEGRSAGLQHLRSKGVAGNADDQIKHAGFKVTKVDNLTVPDVSATTVYYTDARRARNRRSRGPVKLWCAAKRDSRRPAAGRDRFGNGLGHTFYHFVEPCRDSFQGHGDGKDDRAGTSAVAASGVDDPARFGVGSGLRGIVDRDVQVASRRHSEADESMCGLPVVKAARCSRGILWSLW